MARRTFFSFHYKPDVHRAWNVRNAWVTKVAQGNRESAGFFDSSVFEAAQRTNDDSLKRFIRDGLKGTSVTCVLVGENTSLRRWVRYEIFRSFICGNGLLAVRIHSIKNLQGVKASRGFNPFESVAFTIEDDKMRFQEYTSEGWIWAQDVGSMPLNDVPYDLGRKDNHTFDSLFPIYDWATDNGRDNLGAWIEEAAADAGR
jgi:hypothetical protein